jgi:hypothetical protein
MIRNKRLIGLLTGLAVAAVFLSGCGDSLAEKYGQLYSPGEGLAYRSFYFAVKRPTRDPYPVQINDLYGYTRNTFGAHAEMVVEAQFESAKLFTEGLGAVKLHGRWGYIRLLDQEEPSFEYAIPLSFDGAEPFSEGLAAVKSGDRYGYIDPTGQMILTPVYREAHYFSGGLAAVCDENGWYFIDPTGRSVIPGPFEGAESFTGDLAPVKTGGHWGYIDRSGQWVIKAQFDDAWAFDQRSQAAVQKTGHWFMIDPKGNRIWFPALG